MQTNSLRVSALTLQGRNLDNFLFAFWMKWCLRELILKITDLYKQKTTKNSAIIHYLYDPLVLLVSNNAYRSFTLNLKPLNQIIKVVYKAGGTGVQGGIFFSNFGLP